VRAKAFLKATERVFARASERVFLTGYGMASAKVNEWEPSVLSSLLRT
jgi:hypothetical protein